MPLYNDPAVVYNDPAVTYGGIQLGEHVPSRAPEYRVIIRRATTNFAPGDVIADIEMAKNVGFAEYANDVGEAFWTMAQDDPKIAEFLGYMLEPLHVEIIRYGTVEDQVFGGWMGETDETETDVIFYAYSYAAAFFWLHTGWDISWAGQTIAAIVTDCWTNVAVGATGSALAWATTGTIQVPVTESGGSTPLTLPLYEANYKRILFVLQELAAMGVSDTNLRVMFEVTPTGTFNLWKNKGATLSDVKWEFGGKVLSYRRLRSPMDRRNVILGVGSSPHDIVLRQTDENAADRAVSSRREEAVFYEWVRDAEELSRVNKLRLSRGLRDDNQLFLNFRSNSVVPARASDSDYEIGDMAPVLIDNGATQINAPMLVVGQQVLWRRGVEKVRAIVQDSL